jgi:hypothetical protein
MADAGRFDYHHGFKAGQNRARDWRQDCGETAVAPWERFDILFLVSVTLVEQQAGRS